ncbi:MAG TPA: hypothetical protein ENJ09_11940 [Planctomycetes bacterium]|nr:hypothetical protein [Planctomycetota bacterium]
MILRARWVLGPEGRLFDGAVEVEGGEIRRLLVGSKAIRNAGGRVEDLGDGLLAPGFVNAHAHLELGELKGRVRRGTSFVEWVGELLRERETLTDASLRTALERGTARLLETGTTAVGDIASTSVAGRASRGSIRSVVYREVLDAADSSRVESALAKVRRALPKRRLRIEGISPHAPYSVSAPLFDGVRELLGRRPMPVTVHWAETPGEVEWMRSGTGEWAPFLGRSPRSSGLDHIESAGLLNPRTSLVHGNHPEPGDPERIAEAGVVLVHCPGSHAFFDRPPFELGRYLRAGVRIALGTDSLASNEDLDMGRELGLLRRSHPGLAPLEAFRMATEGGAAALGFGRQVGELRPGAWADLAFHRFEGTDPIEEVSLGRGEVAGVWVGGRRVFRRL